MKPERILELLKAARQVVLSEYPYLAAVVYALRFHPKPTRHPDIPVAAVSRGGTLYWNDLGLVQLDPKYYPGIIYHEAKHILLRHFARAEALGIEEGVSDRWNAAADLEINSAITSRSRLKLPKDALFPRQYKLPEGETAEWYYERLPEGARARGGSGSDGIRREWEEDLDRPPLSDADIEVIRRQVVNEYQKQRGRGAGKGVGDAPADMERLVEEVMSPSVPWQRLLAGMIRGAVESRTSATDYSYRRPSRRYGPFVYPGLVGRRPRVALIVDTSGSMSNEELGVALAEVEGIIQTLGDAVDYVAYDADVGATGKAIRKGDVKLVGGGGTDMARAIEYAEKTFRPDVIVVLTDGWTPWPEERPEATVIAAIIENKSAITPPWMKRVDVQINRALAW